MYNYFHILFSHDNNFTISSFIWLATFIGLCLGSLVLAYLVNSHSNQSERLYTSFKILKQVVQTPLICLAGFYTLYLMLSFGFVHLPALKNSISHDSLQTSLNVIEAFIFIWLVINFVRISKAYLRELTYKTQNPSLNIIVSIVASNFYLLIALISVNSLLPLIKLPPQPGLIVKKITQAILIAMVSWVIIKIINAIESFIMRQYVRQNTSSFSARKIQTQLYIVKRIIISLLIVVTIAAILMLFDTLKTLGTGLLTTAGIISAVGAFASQQSLSRIFSGIVIAFTQPFSIGDTIIVDNEFGQVEEITLSYIIVKLWDLRRLILPSDYFNNKSLLNLTKDSSDLLGTIFLYTDFSLPVDELRNKFNEILKSSLLWDKKVSALNVTDMKENCMEIRCLVSAANSSKLWELRCHIRERLIQYIAETFPESLSKTRTLNTGSLTSAAVGHSEEKMHAEPR